MYQLLFYYISDKDHDGKISKEEFVGGGDSSPGMYKFNNIFRLFGVQFAGQLDILKICLHYFPGPSRPKLKLDPEAKAELAFNVFDKNHDGYVTKNEMLKVSKNLTKEQVIFAAISLGAVLK